MHQCRQIGVGVDCGGLIYCVGAALGLPVFDVRNYSRQPDGSLKHVLEAQCTKIRTAEPGDIVIMVPDKQWQHIALLTFDDTVIHAHQSRHTRLNKVIEHRYAEKWRNITVAAYRLPE